MDIIGVRGGVNLHDAALSAPRTIVGLGDSITTHGFGSHAAAPNSGKAIIAWAVMLSEGHLGFPAAASAPAPAAPGDVIYGAAGYTTGQIIADGWHTAAAGSGADYCLIRLGTNDAGSGGYNTQTTRDNFETIFETLLTAGTTPVIETPPPRNDSSTARARLLEIVSWLQTYAADNDLPLVDNYTLLADPITGLWQDASLVDPDGIHPTVEGARAMGTEVARVLRDVPDIRKSLIGLARVTGPELLYTNPLLSDANGDGLPDGWVRVGTVIAQDSRTTVADPDVYGNWFRPKRAAGGVGAAIYRGATMAVTAGDRIRAAWRFRIESVDEVNDGSFTVMMQWGPNIGTSLTGFNWDRPVADGYWSAEFIVPVGCTGVQPSATPSAGSGTDPSTVDAVGRVAQMTLINLGPA